MADEVNDTPMFPPVHELTPEIVNALANERVWRKSISPQYSYYERLTIMAKTDLDLMHRIHSHVVKTGGFWGL